LTTQECNKHFGQLSEYYSAQAGWTGATRNYLYRRVQLLRARKILEVGCGTGEITSELLRRTKAEITAVDIDEEALKWTRERCPRAQLICADAASLDLPDESFDAALCHFTLMWCTDPAAVVAEMARVEYPESVVCGPLIAQGLRRRGADPHVGRKVRGFFRDASLETDVGLASAVWGAGALKASIEAHYYLIRDVVGEEDLRRIQVAHGEALERDVVVFFLPVLWACGVKKQL
jgi:SAM-dependent methyltransferase